ncbi:MAG: NDP-sugar synthase [Verrucomicrobiota bacterium]
MKGPRQAFLLGAGLGTRLRPLTDQSPKPLVPVRNKPLLEYAIDHLVSAFGCRRFLVNTHHRPECYLHRYPENSYGEASLEFRHEPKLLDTAGGLDNIRDWLPPGESIAIYNGDVLSDIALREAWEYHLASAAVATLLLRSGGAEKRVGFDPETQRVVDLRGTLRPDWEIQCQFTGIYFVAPEFLDYLVPGKIESVVFPLLRAIEAGAVVSGFVEDDGVWDDLGNPKTFLSAHQHFVKGFPRYGSQHCALAIDPSAKIGQDAIIDEVSAIGAGCEIGDRVHIEQSVIWPGAVVAPGLRVTQAIVLGDQIVTEDLEGGIQGNSLSSTE